MGSDMAPKASFSNLDEEKMGLEKSVYLVLSELLITKRRCEVRKTGKIQKS